MKGLGEADGYDLPCNHRHRNGDRGNIAGSLADDLGSELGRDFTIAARKRNTCSKTRGNAAGQQVQSRTAGVALFMFASVATRSFGDIAEGDLDQCVEHIGHYVD